jgi:hypothetical protein
VIDARPVIVNGPLIIINAHLGKKIQSRDLQTADARSFRRSTKAPREDS